jgi:hypothetical protein
LLEAFGPKTDMIWDRSGLGSLVKEFEQFIGEAMGERRVSERSSEHNLAEEKSMANATFTKVHCDVFSPASSRRDDDPPERGEVVDRLVRLDRDVSDAARTRVLDLNLHRHWNDKFLTCLWYPHRYNGFQVNEIYLRYGRSRAEMETLERELGIPRLEGDSADFGSFPAHVHISVGVGFAGFFVRSSLAHARGQTTMP